MKGHEKRGKAVIEFHPAPYYFVVLLAPISLVPISGANQ